MTDPTEPNRPQPVLDAAKLGGYVQAAIAAIGGVVIIFYPAVTGDQVSRLAIAVGLAITALVSVAVYVGSVIHAKIGAAQVTPLADPRDNQGRPLVVDPASYGRHAATAADWRGTDETWLADLRQAPVPTPTRQQIPEDVVPGRRLGRHVNHDPRSLNFLVEATGVSQTKVWDRKIPVLDQGNLGSCTGNATTGVLGSEPFYSSLTPAQQKTLNEGEAVQLYSLATALDSYPGTYPPEDTGSDGLSVAKAAQKSGFISAYRHITSVDAAKTAILSGPFIVGTDWLSGMDSPDADGLVHVTGSVRGGHEYECIGYHADTDLFEFVNSWGESWGKAGHFFYSAADLGKLLARQGDATVFVPVGAPFPPQPPVPTPGPAVWPAQAAYDAWKAHTRSAPKAAALIAAVDTWEARK